MAKNKIERTDLPFPIPGDQVTFTKGRGTHRGTITKVVFDETGKTQPEYNIDTNAGERIHHVPHKRIVSYFKQTEVKL